MKMMTYDWNLSLRIVGALGTLVMTNGETDSLL